MDLGSTGISAKPADIRSDRRKTRLRAAVAAAISVNGSLCENSILSRKSLQKLLKPRRLPNRHGGTLFCGGSAFRLSRALKFIRKNVPPPDVGVGKLTPKLKRNPVLSGMKIFSTKTPTSVDLLLRSHIRCTLCLPQAYKVGFSSLLRKRETRRKI